jgi:hypothetical protein
MARKHDRLADATKELTPNRGGDLVQDDLPLSETLPDAGSHQSNHNTQGSGGDADRSDHDDAKVKGQSRPS